MRHGDKCLKMLVKPVPNKEASFKTGVKKTVTKNDKLASRLQRAKRRSVKKDCRAAKANKSLLNERKMNCPTEASSHEDIVGEEEMEDAGEEADKILNEVRNECPFCLKRFDHERILKKHVKKSHKKAYQCDMCRVSCFTEERLAEHRKSHSDDYFFKCDICQKKYKRKESFKLHQMRMHSSDAAVQFVCDYCSKSFKLKVDLFKHIQRKHGTRLFICRYCGKSVRDLYGHERKHKKQAEINNYKFACEICGEKFKNQTCLDNHLLRHTRGYKCAACNLVFTSYRQLTNHKNRMHKASTTCPICKKLFRSAGAQINQHILTHAGIRPYSCDICSEDFTQRSSLLRHRKNHPGPLPPLKEHVPIANLVKNILQNYSKQ